MISSIHIKNFKTLKDTGEVPIKPLTLLTGVNGTGKSSMIQVLLLILQSHWGSKDNFGYLKLDGHLADIGTAKDALYYFANTNDEQISLDIRFSDKTLIFAKYTYYPTSKKLSPYNDSTDNKEFIQCRGELFNDRNKLKHSLFNGNFQYLNAMHIGPEETYNEGNLHDRNPLGIKGEYTVHYLNHHANRKQIAFDNLHHPNAKSRGLVHEVNAWLGEISPNVRLKTTKIPGSELIIAGYEFGTQNDYTDAFKPKNVGFGISYVLPVITAILSAEPGRLIIIENPEAHLHPRGQARMGRLMALAAQNYIQLIVETHSDHILNGIRVAVKKDKVDADRVSLLYFKREIENREHRAKIIIPKIDQDGRIDKWPEGFFDEWENMLDELI